MDNKSVSRTLKVMSKLMELHDQNIFKVRSVANASFKIDKLPFPIDKKTADDIAAIDGIGKSIASKITELIQTGSIAELDALVEITPPGVIELMSIKGLGPKKVQSIWHDLKIETVGELYYACNENRLIEAKGFGLKTQEEIKAAIEFKMAGTGKFLYAHVEEFALELEKSLKAFCKGIKIALTGGFRRRNEIIESLDLLVGHSPGTISEFITTANLMPLETGENLVKTQAVNGLVVNFHFCSEPEFEKELFLSTGSADHISGMSQRLEIKNAKIITEEELYLQAGLPYIAPELREGVFEFDLAASGNLNKLIQFNDLKGSLHNHSTWSDGVNSLKEMALFCRDELGLAYFGISDHSKTAVYAKGLSEERVWAQQAEIDQLNSALAPFKIFKGIESDILPDGSLDYPDDLLNSFDFIVASIHSAFKMDEEKATARLIKAIENPYTTILGHPTGRLLLSRAGYPVDFKKVIDACSANQVAIEINANPLRLDLDWRWHRYAIDKGVLLAINPDAHRTTGFYDMHYGVLVARKGGVFAENCLNTFSLEQITDFFDLRKSRISTSPA